MMLAKVKKYITKCNTLFYLEKAEEVEFMRTQHRLDTPMLDNINRKIIKLMDDVVLKSKTDVVLENIKYCHYVGLDLKPDIMAGFLFGEDKKEFYEERVAIICESGELSEEESKLLALYITIKS